MGDPLSARGLQSFADELALIEKNAAIPGLKAMGSFAAKHLKRPLSWTGEGIRDTARLATQSPLKSLREGWAELGPEAIQAHLKPGGGNRAQELAKRLSRSGWTGQGKVTKYLPNVMGAKALTVGGTTAAAIPEMMQAVKKDPTRTGEGGLGEVGLGEAAGLAGMITGGRRFIPSTLLYLAGRKAGRGVGRFVDRTRAGADPITAAAAPSPEEADRQLQSIGRHYG